MIMNSKKVETQLVALQEENMSLTAEVMQFKAQLSTMVSLYEDVKDIMQSLPVLLKQEIQKQEGTLMEIHTEAREAHRFARYARNRIAKLSGNAPTKHPVVKYTAKKAKGLNPEKAASEIVSTLYGKMEKPSPPSLRAFYTDLEREVGKPLSQYYKDHKSNFSGDLSHYPNRKIDTILKHVDADFVLSFAKKYTFKTK